MSAKVKKIQGKKIAPMVGFEAVPSDQNSSALPFVQWTCKKL